MYTKFLIRLPVKKIGCETHNFPSDLYGSVVLFNVTGNGIFGEADQIDKTFTFWHLCTEMVFKKKQYGIRRFYWAYF